MSARDVPESHGGTAAMDSLSTYYLDALSINRATFIERHRGLFLLRVPENSGASAATEAAPGWDDDSGRHPRPHSVGMEETVSERAARGVGSVAEGSKRAQEWGAAAVRKRPGFQPYNRVVVGRMVSCDVVLPYPSVSKQHAYFHIEEHQVRALSDRSSTLGTFINGRRLEPGEVAAIHAGDMLRFGEVALMLVDASTLYTVLQAL